MQEIERELATLSAPKRALLARWLDERLPARPREEGSERLVAYAAARPGHEPDPGELRRFLGERLPEHMVPSVFVLLDALPLNPNGKVDRRALPPPGAVQRQRQTPFVAPRTPAERTLAEVWRAVLSIDRIGIHDNFFELGGDSIRSIQLMGRCHEHGLRFTLEQLTRHPTIADLARAIEGAREDAAPDRRFELVADEDRARLAADVEDAYPMARLQTGMLFHIERSPELPVYHEVLSYHLRGPLDLDLLRQALREVIEVHPVLRTSLHVDGFREPLQLVHRQVAVPLTAEDLRHLAPAEQDATVDAWMAAEEKRRYNPETVPLFRFHVQIRGAETFQLNWSCHHAILDGWSAAALLAEIFQRYLRALGDPVGPVPPPPAVSYRDFVALERETLRSEEARRFWQDGLEGGSFLRLPRFPDTSDPSPGDMVLPPATSDRLRELARRLGVTLKSVLLAAHARVLGLLGAGPDVTTGLVVNGRPERADGDRVLGLFLNTLPLRLRMPGGVWAELIREAFAREEEMLPFRRYPLSDLQREMGGQPLFETAFNFANFHVVGGLLGLGRIEYLAGRFVTRIGFPFAASFVIDPNTSAVALRLEVDRSQIGGAQVQSILGWYARILEAMAADASGRYEVHLPFSAAERHQMLCEWNDTRIEEGRRTPFHERFRAQVARAPEAVAATQGEERITYGDLNVRANRLAHHLRRLGVGPEVRVGLYLKRSLDHLVGFLSILKSGGAYVPLDPHYPQERLRFLVEDSGAAVILTCEALAPTLPAGSSRLVLLDAEAPAIARCDAGDPPGEIDPWSLAYIIYTSGSTGRPKGVMVPHEGLRHVVELQRRHFPISADGRSLQVLSLSFDGSLFELCLPLAAGATLCMGPPEGQVIGPELLRLLREQAVTHAALPPSMLATLPAEELPALRNVVVGGETCPPELAARWLPGRRFLNGYGTTETEVLSTVAESTDGAAPDIGRPVADAVAHVLDAHLQPLPLGVAGELYLGGSPVARGYLGRPDLTAERFVPDPFASEPGGRLYRTGDLVRRRPAGDLEYLGRIDQQVQLHGLRIELGEIETALRRHPAVAEGVVVLHRSASGNQFLVGYVVFSPSRAVVPAELRAFLKQRLPAHLIPSAFVSLDRLPLTSNGKLDLAALPAPEELQQQTTRKVPRTPTEEILAGLWAEVLGMEDVGVEDDFFLRGGQSLLATQLVARLRRTFGIELPLQALFDVPTVAGLARLIEQALAGAPALPPLERLPREGDPPLSFAQERLWFLDRLEPGNPAYHMPAALRLSGALRRDALEGAMAEVERRHEVLRTVYADRSEGPVQVIVPPRGAPLGLVDLSALSSAERHAEAGRLLPLLARQPFDLANGPLWRKTLLRLDEREHTLLLAVHHIAGDGWSMGVLVREVATLYESFAAGRPPSLPDLPVQYADYALWQRRWLQGEVLDKELAWWRQRLAGASGTLELPTDRPRPEVQTWRGAGFRFRLNEEIGNALRELDHRERTTRFMSLLAAFQALLHRYSGQPDVIVGTPIAGRRHLDTEALIGCFINTLALRGDLAGSPGFRQLLARTRDMVLGAYAHQDIPFERVVEDLQPQRDLSRTPVFQALFVLQNAPMPALELPGLTLSTLEIETGATPFDLTLSILEVGNAFEGLLQYRTDLFETATIARLAGNLERLLAAALDEPDRPIAELPLLGETVCARQLFEARAALAPDAVAVRSAGSALKVAPAVRQAAGAAYLLVDEGYVPPRTPLEEELAAIWAEVLGVARVGAHDSFFDLGGHSLLATRIASRVCEAFGVELPLRALFQAPTVAGLAELIGRAAVPELPAERGKPAPPIVPVPRTGPMPVSFAQQRLWFLDRLQPGSSTYNIPLALRIRGPLEPEILRRAFAELVRRHETLRTTIPVVDSEPAQVIHPPASPQIPRIDLSGLDRTARLAEAWRLVAHAMATPFDLACGPLLRVTLLELGEDERFLLTVMHHIVTDGWSGRVLVGELATLYQAFSAGAPSPLPELPVQYADYAVWQRAWLPPLIEEQLRYWKERLADAPPSLDLPADRPRPLVQTSRGGREIWVPPARLARDLAELSRRRGATLFMTLLAAFDALLCRSMAQEDVVLGSPIAGRTRTETEGLIGFFVNMLVLRVDLSGDPAFEGVLRRARETTLAAYARQDVPFEMVVEALQPRRDLGRTPLFQVVLAFQNAPEEPFTFPGLALEPLELENNVAEFDLVLYLVEAGRGTLEGWLKYNRDLFDATTVRRLGGHLESLLEAVAADPAQRLSELPLLSAAERQQLLAEWNDTPSLPVEISCLHQQIEARVDLAPDAIAVELEGSSLSYGELDRQANRLAHALRAAGVGPESLVGLCIERSPEMMVALLGVLKAGGAYVPLDPSYPRERLAYMVEDSRAAVVLTRTRDRQTLPDLPARFLCLDQEDLSSWSAERPSSLAIPDNPAYVLYTSGSTGRPKGVVITHRGLAHQMAWLSSAFAFTPADRMLQKTPFSFDASVWELFAPLLAGARVVLARPGDHQHPDRLVEAVQRHGVTILQVVPALLGALLNEPGLADCRSLRWVSCGGEALAGELAERFFSRLDADLMNLYGPTECTIQVSWWRCRLGEHRRGVPIGRPMANVRIHLLDPWLQPVPLGVPGELHIGGVQVARGYLGRPDLTAERFLPNPFPETPGSRLYRTGDLARHLAGGEIEFLHRIDSQLKVRGFRIELGEIEASLLQSGEVAAAVALVREDAPGDQRLVAYVVPAPGGGPEAAEELPAALQRSLGERLPAYMLPAAFVVLQALPLLPNGKVDRRALPAPDWEAEQGAHRRRRRRRKAAFVAPRNAVEEVMAGLFAEVLRLERVGVESSFFELGGHSLLATQLVSRIRAAFQVELPLRKVFEAPTAAALSVEVETARAGVRRLEIPPVEPAPRDGELPLSFAQERLWFLDQLSPGSAAYNIPHALRLAGRLSPSALERSIGEIVRRHEVLRTTFEAVAGRPRQVIHSWQGARLPAVDLGGLPAGARWAELADLLAAEARRPFDLARGPVLRPRLFRLGPQDHVLWLGVHHIAADGWSTAIFSRELAALYESFLEGTPSPLPELPIQYADFAVWQRRWLRGDSLEGHLDYWRGCLAAAEPLRLATDRPRSGAADRRSASERLEISGDLARRLQARALRANATLFMTVLSAWMTLLHRYTGALHPAVGSPIANRNRKEIEPLIGFFVNMLVLQGDLSGDPAFSELLGRVRETVLGAHAHQDLPFELLVQTLQPERDLTVTPLFQVVLAFQNRLGGPLELPGLCLEPLEVGTGTAKFELTVTLAETAERLAGGIEYDQSLFDAATIRRLGGHLQELLTGAAADPETRLSDLPLLTAAERWQLLEWSAGPALPVEEVCLHDLIAAQADRTPEAPAVEIEGACLSYGELDRLANRLAHKLRAAGVGPESLVGLCIERSLEMMVALLGVLKAGGAYVPLDPSYPRERLAYMLEDSRAAVVLTRACDRQALPDLPARFLCLDQEDLSSWSAERPRSLAIPDNPAYVLYTSGSTGRSKGVVIPHRGLVHQFVWLLAAFALTPADRLLQRTPLSFDASVWELFTPLLAGARVVLARPGEHRHPDRLVEAVQRHEVTILPVVPALLGALLNEPGLADCRSVRWVVCGAEALAGELAERCLSRLDADLTNFYGPTECTIQVSWWPCRPGEHHLSVPIGRPMANVRIHLLDPWLQPVPPGVPGELYIGGVQVGRGYLGRPDLTAERFLPDPFSEAPGSRLYRTGDLARHLAGGEIEFLDRIDSQVKVRGYRIELGEIEATLLQHGRVAAAVAAVREDAPGDRRLAAYVVPTPGWEAADLVAELRDFLSERLPAYMVPAAFVALAALPTLPNGKVDRRALPAPDPASLPSAVFVAPRDLLELRLAQLWEEVLGRSPVGIRDDFFDLGGYSLLAVHLIARIEQVFGKRLPVAVLFQEATVQRIAELLREQAAPDGRRSLVALQTRGSRPPSFWVHGAGGTVFCYLELARHLGTGRPFYGLQAPEFDGEPAEPATVEAMAARYLDEVRTVQPQGPYLLGGWSLGGVVAFEMAQQLLGQGERVQRLVLLDSQVPGPPARAPRVPELALLGAFARNLGVDVADPFRVARGLRRLTAGERLSRLLEEAQRTGAVPADFDLLRLQRLFEVFKTGIRAVERYAPRPYLGRITLVRAEATAAGPEDLGWSGLASAGVEVHLVPGDHFTLLREPNVERLAEMLRTELEEEESERGSAGSV